MKTIESPYVLKFDEAGLQALSLSDLQIVYKYLCDDCDHYQRTKESSTSPDEMNHWSEMSLAYGILAERVSELMEGKISELVGVIPPKLPHLFPFD